MSADALAGALGARFAFVVAGVAWLASLDRLLLAARTFDPGAPLRALTRPFFKESRATEHPDSVLSLAAPLLLAALVMGALSVLPLSVRDRGVDLDVGVVFFTAQFALVSVAVFLAGWAPNSKYPLIAGYRFVALMLAYEMPFALAVIAVALEARSLDLNAIVADQVRHWNLLRQPLGFALYLVAAFGIAFWPPLNAPTRATLAGGVTAELSGGRRALWRFWHYALLLTVCAFAVPLYLGGGGTAWCTMLKALAIASVVVCLAHAVPAVPLARFMLWAWVALIPLGLVNLFGVGLWRLLARGGGG